ncbi:hypothetical protein OUZ56_016717 [Daphnia magna]|uniref:Transposable element P transposase-like RNase H domain-containing protein n=1 Tax=Daphnia magna TaxID=35525 RepID=A0ABR0ARG8_9CRUS|nr:hypothetical protein OUZ56_016717 [Daphnia magna]
MQRNKELLNVVKTIEQEKEELMVLAKKDSVSIHLKTLPAQKATLSKNDISGKGMRWNSTYLVQCAMIKMKSSSVYRSLREKELLPLPSEETFRKIVSSMECCFGWNELALFNVGEDMKGKHEPDRWCSVMWDEIKLKPDMDWDQRSKKLRGIVDYGENLFSKTNSAIHKNSKVSKFQLHTRLVARLPLQPFSKMSGALPYGNFNMEFHLSIPLPWTALT